MKTLILMMYLIGLISSCKGRITIGQQDTEPDKKPNTEHEYAVDCISAGENSMLLRCENNEVICYTRRSSGGGISCKFKETK